MFRQIIRSKHIFKNVAINFIIINKEQRFAISLFSHNLTPVSKVPFFLYCIDIYKLKKLYFY